MSLLLALTGGGGGVTGTLATSQAQTISAAGAAAPLSVDGTVTTSQAQTASASGSFTAIGVTGTGALSQAQTIAGTGSASVASVSGTATTSQAQTIVSIGSFTGSGGVTGTATTSQAHTIIGIGLVTSGTQVIHGPNNQRKAHKTPTYEDYLKSTAQEDREYLDKLYKVDEATLEVLNKEAKTLVQIENIYHNTEQDREKLRQALIDEGIAYRDAYLEVYTGLVNEYRQAQEDEAIAAVIAAML